MKRIWIYTAILVIAIAFIQNIWAQKSIQESTELITTVRAPNWPDSLVVNQVNVHAILILPNITFVGASNFFRQDLSYLWVSVNNGPWVQKGFKEGLTPIFGHITSLVANSSGQIFAGGLDGLFMSADNGNSWVKIQNFSVSDLIVTPNAMFAADTGIFRSTDDGASWVQVAGKALTYPYVQELEYSSSSGIVFAGISSGMPTGGNGVLRSFDNGDSWSFVNSGLSSHKNVYGIASQNNSTFVVTEDDGVYQSLNNGNTWSKFPLPETDGTSAAALKEGTFFGANTIGKNRSALYRYRNFSLDTVPGYSSMAVLSIAVVSSNKIAVGTQNGLYITTFSILSTPVEESPNVTPKVFSLSQNYPNPFNPSTTIEFSLLNRGNVNLVICNTIGQKMETIVSGELSAGNHRYVWNAGKYSSGIYFYRLETNNFVQTKKMLLVK